MDLEATLESGQAFCWRRLSKGRPARYEGVIEGTAVELAQRGDMLLMRPLGGYRGPLHALRKSAAHYFDLETDYQAPLAELVRLDPRFRRVLSLTHGLRILRQDPWETLATFIMSTNNNIPRIKRMAREVSALSRAPAVEVPGRAALRPFPTPSELLEADEQRLIEAGLGYRAQYLLDAARRVASGALDLERLSRLDPDAARRGLLEVKGVGSKVAECVLLYGLGIRNAFPVDVWTERALLYFYPDDAPRRPQDLARFARKLFGDVAGYAQVHLYAYARRYLRPGARRRRM